MQSLKTRNKKVLPKTYTIQELSKILNISYETARLIVKRNELSYVVIGKSKRILPVQLDEYIKSRTICVRGSEE